MIWDVDGARLKTFEAIEGVKLTFRAEAFNGLNHKKFRKLKSTSVGSTSILSSNFGEAYRVVQFVLKMVF